MRLALACVLACAACGGGHTVDGTTRPEAGLVREVFRVLGEAAPPNATTGGVTPTALEATQVARYRVDVDPPAAAHAIIVAYPGFLGGAGTFDGLARAMVRQSAETGAPVEVWAIDRRANLLEDLTGEDAAEGAGDPERATRYYFNGADEDGQHFSGFKDQADVDYMSEWGFTVHAEDLHRVIALVPKEARRDRVVLLGHSLGASFAEAYAASRLADGTHGVDELAGLVLIDGVLGDAPISETAYHAGMPSVTGDSLGLDAIRSTTRYQSLPFFGVELYARIEILSLRALLHPDALTVDASRDDFLRLALALGPDALPKLTDQAVLGFGFDAAFNPFSFARATLGKPTGGPLASYSSTLSGETLSQPSDPNSRYAWSDDAQSGAITTVAGLAHAFVDGRTNFAEWYFPARLGLDLAAVGGARVAEGSWQAQAGLRVFDGASIDAPILAVAAALVTTDQLTAVRRRVAPAIGAGRVAAGLTRDDPRAFRLVQPAGEAHLDPVLAGTGPTNHVPADVVDFIGTSVPAGTIAIPRQAPIP